MTAVSHNTHHSGGHTACVSLVPIFNHLDEQQLEEIMETTQSMSYRRGETLYRAGDSSDSLYIVSKGKIRIYRLAESGKEQLVRMLQPGAFTGELALFNQKIHEANAEAMEDTEVCRIKRVEFQKLLMRYPSISLKVLTEFSHRLEQSEKQTALFAAEKAETRIAFYLADRMEEQQKSEFDLPMTKKDLASYLGISPETLSRRFTTLELKGYIKQKSRKRIEILDLDGLLLS